MTRKSKREIERAIEDVEIEEGGQGQTLVANRDPRTGELTDGDGEPIEAGPEDVLIVIDEAVVMDREQAEAEGREILGPAESETNPDADLVRVYWDRPT